MHDQDALNQKLQKLIDEGKSLDEAIVVMFKSGDGALFLGRAVAHIAKYDSATAHRLVARATCDLHR